MKNRIFQQKPKPWSPKHGFVCFEWSLKEVIKNNVLISRRFLDALDATFQWISISRRALNFEDFKATHMIENRLKSENVNQVSDLDNNNVEQDLDNLLNKLDGLGLEVIADIRKELDGLSIIPVDTLGDGRFFHRGPNGLLYRLEIRKDEKSPKVAAKRFAVALDEEEVVVLEGPKSFASDTNILLDEIKFRIDNQLS